MLTARGPAKLVAHLARVGFLALAVGASQAGADIISFDLTSGNSGGIGGFPGPYQSVTVNRTSSTTAIITFDSLSNGAFFYRMGGDAAAVNLNVTTGTVTFPSGSSGSGVGFTPGPFSVGNPPGTHQMDGFGKFNVVINDFDGYTHSATEITFDVTNTGGTWASASDVLVNNAAGFEAATHTFVCSDLLITGCDASVDALATGFASGSTSSGGGGGSSSGPIPEPATLALVGLALAGLGFNRRRRSA